MIYTVWSFFGTSIFFGFTLISGFQDLSILKSGFRDRDTPSTPLLTITMSAKKKFKLAHGQKSMRDFALSDKYSKKKVFCYD